jgi:hypothetical protein
MNVPLSFQDNVNFNSQIHTYVLNIHAKVSSGDYAVLKYKNFGAKSYKKTENKS